MALLNFFKTPRHQRYNYIPRFYDPKKEDLEERLRIMEGVKSGDTEDIKKRISGGFRASSYASGASTYRNKQVVRSNIMLIVIVVVLCLLAYLMTNIYLEEIVDLIEHKNL
ncbi:MAG: hypothetical protein AAGK47_10385 [Bacteroidota bacterium]